MSVLPTPAPGYLGTRHSKADRVLCKEDPHKRLVSSFAAYDGHTAIKCRGPGGDYPRSFRSQLDHDHPAILQSIEFKSSKRLLEGHEKCSATLGAATFKPDV
jgi:hypothetical protein